MQLYLNQKKYAHELYKQIRNSGIGLLQLPTGQGKTIIALKVVANILRHSKHSRPIVLVTRRREDAELFSEVLHGNPIEPGSYDDRPWIRDTGMIKGGLQGLCKGGTCKIGKVSCRSTRDLSTPLPIGAIVIFDEIHRFVKHISRMRLRDTGGSITKQRYFLLLSATPVNPVRITSDQEKGEIDFEKQMEEEDEFIKNSFTMLYKSMINLSTLNESRKEQYTDILEHEDELSLDNFAQNLRKVMKVLKPIPDPDTLIKLGPSGKVPYSLEPHTINPVTYSKSVSGLLKFHENVPKIINYYCAERMALAGVVKRGKKSVGFRDLPKIYKTKGLFHFQPGLKYAEDTIAALRTLNGSRTAELLSEKIDQLYAFLRRIWKTRYDAKKWRVLIYCAHRGSVAALASELEKRFYDDNIVCNCLYTSNDVYGHAGGRRVVWDTEGYHGSKIIKETESEQILVNNFCKTRSIINCTGNNKNHPCPLGFVMVTSDRLSESIDLHHSCQIMVHFDLDWSPLRMIQRYGRLWRIDKKYKRRPKPPAVFHMIQPGSVDDEIKWRLEQRWKNLEKLKLGLETVKLDHALGERIY